MTALPWWEITRDLVIVCALLAGYGWLAVLSARVQALSRRLGTHVCRERDLARRARAAAETTQPIAAAQAEGSDQGRRRR